MSEHFRFTFIEQYKQLGFFISFFSFIHSFSRLVCFRAKELFYWLLSKWKKKRDFRAHSKLGISCKWTNYTISTGFFFISINRLRRRCKINGATICFRRISIFMHLKQSKERKEKKNTANNTRISEPLMINTNMESEREWNEWKEKNKRYFAHSWPTPILMNFKLIQHAYYATQERITLEFIKHILLVCWR